MVEQYGIQYDLNVCCLRAPWVMEKDDFKYQLSFGDDVFGGPRWRDLVGAHRADGYAANGTIPVMLDQQDRPVKWRTWRDRISIRSLEQLSAVARAIRGSHSD